MRDLIVLDEFHTTIVVHREVAKAENRAIRHNLRRCAFQKRLEEAIRLVIAKYPSIRQIRFSLSS